MRECCGDEVARESETRQAKQTGQSWKTEKNKTKPKQALALINKPRGAGSACPVGRGQHTPWGGVSIPRGAGSQESWLPTLLGEQPHVSAPCRGSRGREGRKNGVPHSTPGSHCS